MLSGRLLLIWNAFTVVAAFVVPRHAIVTPRSVRAPVAIHSRSASLAATAVDAISTLQTSQTSTIYSIAASVPDLQPKPDFTWNPGSVRLSDGTSVTLDARDAPGPANIAWLASLCVDGKLSSLTIFNGPLTDVPHLVSRCAVVGGNSLQFTLDFRPRKYGAYEMKRPDGTYPGPDELGRKSFEYSGARMEYDSKFGTDQVQSFLKATLDSFQGATPHDPNPTELDVLTRGPLYTSVMMPLTEGNVAAVADARDQAANFWLSWSLDNQHEHRPGAPVNTQYVYDTKFKQNAFGALLNDYSRMYGDADGKTLAVGESGPLDEAYVGGAS